MASPTISIPVQFVTECGREESPSQARERIASLIRNAISVMDLSLEIGSIGNGKDCDQEYQSGRVIRLHGRVVLSLLASDYWPGENACLSFVRRFVAIGIKSLYLCVDPASVEEDVVFYPLALPHTLQATTIRDFQLGSRVGYTDFVSHFGARAAGMGSYRFSTTFEHDLSKFRINFFVQDYRSLMPNVGRNYEVRVKYNAVSSVVLMPDWDEQGEQMLRVYFMLKSPPLLYEMEYTEEDARRMASKSFCRATSFPVPVTGRHISKRDWGRSNVLSMDLPFALAGAASHWSQDHETDPWFLVSNFKRFTDFQDPIPFYFAYMDDYKWNHLKSLPGLGGEKGFPVYYAVRCCMSISHQFSDDLCLNDDWDKFFAFVQQEAEYRMSVVEQALYDLFRILERNAVISVMSAFRDTYYRLVKSKYVDYTSVKGVRKIRRAILTPTRVVLLPPHPFVESRFMKLCEPDFALRCHVRDDDDDMLTFSAGSGSEGQQKEFLMKHIRDPVMRGIRIGHRTYHLLGSSSSQIRDHGFILYAEDNEDHDADYYRRTLGDLSSIRCVGKFIARLGQSFSQMQGSVLIDSKVLPTPVKDIMHGRHPISGKQYCFTDGVSYISIAMAREFVADMDLDHVPSAYQIRYKGIKGVVVIHDMFNDTALFLGYRDSMDKFPCDSDTLEILKYSCPRPVYLNRPLVNLLDQLGTPHHAFDKLLVNQLTRLTNAFLDEDSAMQCISSFCPALTKLFALGTISQSGISILSEPFFRNVLDIVVKKKFRELKENARIPIPMDQGRNMFGVCDEYRCIEYGQVFVQYTDMETRERKVLTGEVMVTKNPCMHPGDVRKFMAVDRPQLHHIVDCIVFPTKGERPHPNEMAGSDLDGDEYSVFWMKDLFFSEPNQTAMVFSDDPPLELDRPVETSDIMEFICEFIRTNKVGLIGNAHLAISDRTSIHNPKCLELCEKSSQALDFAKTGKNVEMLPEDRARIYPDFMDKGAKHPTYKSTRSLGVLYNQVSLFEKALCNWGEEADLSPPPNPLIQCEGWEEFEDVALDDFSRYKMTCDSLLKELGIESEEHLLSCICQRNGKFVTGKREDIQELVERIVKDKFAGFRYQFEEGTANDLDRQKKAVAYYMVARVKQGSMSGKKWYGFPWIAGPELAALVRRSGTEKNQQESVISDLINGGLIRQYGSISWACPTIGIEPFLEDWSTKDAVRNDAPDVGKLSRKMFAFHRLHQMVGLDGREHGHESDAPRPTPGQLVVHVLKQLIIDMMTALQQNGGDHVIKLVTMKLGFSAMVSLNRCFRTGKIDCLFAPDGASSRNNQPKLRSYYVALGQCVRIGNQFMELVYEHPNKVVEYLAEKNKVIQASARVVSQPNHRYWLLTAEGDEWSLANLSGMLIQPNFHSKAYQKITQSLRKENRKGNKKKAQQK